MMRNRLLPVPVGLLLFSLLAPAWGQDVLKPLTVSPQAVAAGNISVETLQAARQAPAITGFGQVLDPTRLTALAAGIAEAKAEVAAMDARLKLAETEANRAAGLFHAQGNVSLAEYQSAQSAGQVAAANLAVAQAKLRSLAAGGRATWGTKLEAAAAMDSGLLAGIEAGQTCLVEVTLPLGVSVAPAPAEATANLASGSIVALRFVDDSPQSPAGNGPSFYYLGERPNCPPVGAPLRAELSSGPEDVGVVVPKSAVVWRAATPIVFRRSADADFTPTVIPTNRPTPNGYFVRSDGKTMVKPGETIVVAGAALLLSQAETGETGAAVSSAQTSDDDD